MSIGDYRNYVLLDGPGDPPTVPDGFGGYTENWTPLDPPDWYCAIEPASARSLEDLGAGTVLSQASHIVKGRYHAGITTATRIHHDGRILNVVYVTNRDERRIESDLVCAEVLS
jgi:head-tail adaptor